MNERRNLFVGAAEDLRNPARVIRVSCRKPHKGRLYLFSVFARHTYADQKAHGRRHFIRQLTEMIHHAFDVTNIFKHNAKRSFFNSTNRFLGAGKNDFLFGGEVIVDAAVLQLCRLTEVLCRGNGQPLFDKAVKADAYKLLSLFGFLFFPQNTIPPFLCIIQCFL